MTSNKRYHGNSLPAIDIPGSGDGAPKIPHPHLLMTPPLPVEGEAASTVQAHRGLHPGKSKEAKLFPALPGPV